jgi:hypothetical protein
MSQIFRPIHNHLARLSIAAIVLLPILAGFLAYTLERSSYFTNVNDVMPQPVQFSHEHHVGGLGIDCRYCHTSVETSAFAGIPPTHTCMTCHSQVWTDAPILQPVVQSFVEGRPIRWTRVHDLPDFVYFHHGIHIQKGIGCSTCHGAVDTMPLMRKEVKFHMRDCLQCHQQPERFRRTPGQIFQTQWEPHTAAPSRFRRPITMDEADKPILIPGQPLHLLDCGICHR